MANEITVTAELSYTNTSVNIATQDLAVTSPGTFTIIGQKFVLNTFSVPTTAGGTILPLGSIGTLGWAMVKNNDAVNYVEILVTTSGTAIIKLKAGECALFRFGSGVTAPAALANTGAVVVQYMFIEN